MENSANEEAITKNITQSASSQPLVVGVWLVFPSGLHWRGEGIGRTIEWIIEGFKDAELLGKHVVFKIAVSSWIRQEIERSIHHLIGDLSGIEFVSYTTPKHRFVMLIDRIFSLNGLIKSSQLWIEDPIELTHSNIDRKNGLGTSQKGQLHALSVSDEVQQSYTSGYSSSSDHSSFDTGASADYSQEGPRFVKLGSVKRRPHRKNLADAKRLGSTRLRNEIAGQFGAPEAPVLPYLENLSFRERWKERARFKKASADYKRKHWEPISKKLLEECAERPSLPGIEVANKILKVLRRIPLIRIVVGGVMRIVNPTLQESEIDGIEQFASVVDETTKVDVWWVPSPNCSGPEYLRRPIVANFWDFVIGEYGFLWDHKSLDDIYHRVKIVMHKASAILTQSHHNLKVKLINGFMVESGKATVCYLTTPKSYIRNLPTFAKTQVRSSTSREEANGIIKAYLRRKMYIKTYERVDTWHRSGLELERLLEFPFDKATYAICSTQSRPYKNLDFLVDTYLWMIQKYKLDVYLILTSEFDISNKNDPIGSIIWKRRMIDRVYSMHRVPNKVHAALYHNASCTLHPSFTEGGVGSYPFLEGMTMGTPGLVAQSEYSLEGYRLHPNYDEIFMSANDKKSAARKIKWVIENRDEALKLQTPIFHAHNIWDWQDVARVYSDVMFKSAARETPSQIIRKMSEPRASKFFLNP